MSSAPFRYTLIWSETHRSKIVSFWLTADPVSSGVSEDPVLLNRLRVPATAMA